ncbi:MAG TPA: hypothetical protein VF753_16835 [Terriglobales bacterium]
MKTVLLAGTVLAALGSLSASDKNPADYTLSAHILGTARHRSPGGITSVYNPQTATWSHGTYSGSTQHETDLRIDKMIYSVARICKKVEVGKDYPAKVDKKKIHLLLPDGKTCDGIIEGIHEME